MELEDKIKKVLDNEKTKKSWRNKHSSDEWLIANDVSIIVMREPLNRANNCGCLNDLYYMLKNITKSQIKLKKLQMENEFELKQGILLFYKGTHYSNANITDEKSLEILSKFPVKINAYTRFPKDWKNIATQESAPIKNKGIPKDIDNSIDEDFYIKELEVMEESKLRSLCDELFANGGAPKKAHHKAGVDKMIKYLIDNKVNG